ncbi:MAG: hypothetical protein JXA21_15625 [Anaerolineae bacterium]|nr:hypothetical protein [Anaerolineae bacterium]
MSKSKPVSWQCILLIVACVYACLRFAVHLIGLSSLVQYSDLPIYLLAAERLLAHQPLYHLEELAKVVSFQYAPVFALYYAPLRILPTNLIALLLSLLYPITLALLFWRWNAILQNLQLEAVRQALWKLLPIVLVYEVFWSDLGYLNVYTLTSLLTTLLLEAILARSLPRTIFWLAIILPIKPFWAFPVLLPLIFGRWRFFLKLIVGGMIAYLALAVLTGAIVGWGYAFEQYMAYFDFLSRLSSNFSWRVLAEGNLLGYNHSIKQVIVYFLGVSPLSLGIATILKGALLLPLVLILFKEWENPTVNESPSRQLNLFWGLYLAVFIWLDVVWEVALGWALCAYLWPYLAKRWEQLAIGATFGVMAMLDPWRLASFIVGGEHIIGARGEILTDPSTYVPLILAELLVFYGLWFKNRAHMLSRNSWTAQPTT